MTFENLIYLLIIIILVIVSGFFSGSETAITAVSRARIHSKSKQGDKKAGFVEKLLNQKEELVTSLLLSNNLVNVLSSALATAFFLKIFGNTGILYATILMTIILVIFAEVLPKTYALNTPTRTAIKIGKILTILLFLLKPFVLIINILTKSILRDSTKKSSKSSDLQTEEELEGAIGLYDTSDPDSKKEKLMLQNILNLSDTTVSEVMVHRSNIFSINIDDPISKIIKQINTSRFTRIPFWKKTPENIIGILNSRFILFGKDLKDEITKDEIISLIKKPWFVPESTDLLDQLVEFKNKKEHLTLVVDEYGELLGLITLEDLIEEIVGDIVDEIDEPDSSIIKDTDGTIYIEGSVSIRDLNKNYNWDLPEEKASTIGGFIINISKRIPLYGEIIKYKNIEFKILSHSRKKVIRLKARKV